MKVCFWGNIGSALMGNTDGGGELQLSLLAKALARAGHEAVVVDYNLDKEFVTEEGIKVVPIKGYNKGIRGIRTFTHRLPRLYSSLRNQRADLYYCRIRDFRHILAYRAARKVKAKFVIGMAHDLDAMPSSMRIRNRRFFKSKGLWGVFNHTMIELIHPYLLRKADKVIVQHEGQKNILLRSGIRSVLLSNLMNPTSIPAKESRKGEAFIYVGELRVSKGFQEFFEIVNMAPFHSFKVVGLPKDKPSRRLYEKLKIYDNVSLLGRMSHADTLMQIENSKALISTSPVEGFPNVFIEAWACGIPVISLYVDPGDVIEKEKLGYIANGDLNKIVHAINNVEASLDFAKRSKSYVDRVHVLNEQRIEEISNLFTEILNAGKN